MLSESLPTLPAGWYWTTLGEIAEVVGGGTPRTSDPANFEGGDVPWITPADLSGYTEKYISHGARFITRKGLESSAARLLPAGTVLFSSRAPIGYVVIASNPIATNQGFKSFVLKYGVLPEYVYWWLKGSKQSAESLASGTTFLELSGANAKKLPIPIAPIDEQRRIVGEIEKQFSRLDEAVANLERVKANLRRFRAAVLTRGSEGEVLSIPLAHALGGHQHHTGSELREQILKARRVAWEASQIGRAKYKQPAPPETEGLSPLPAGWAWITLEELGPADRACAYGVLQPGEDRESGVPFVRVGDISDGRVDIAGLKRIDPQIAAKYPRTQLEGGELLITLVGTIGRTAVAPPELKGANVARAVGVVPLVPQVDARWVEIWFRAPNQIRRLNGQAHEVARKTLNLEDVRRAVVPLPPLQQQRQIVEGVETLLTLTEAMQADVESAESRAESMRRAIFVSALLGATSEGAS